MSCLYMAHPLHGAGLVAVKQLKESADPAEYPEDLRQFEAEYRILLALDHPSLPRVLEFFEENGRHYLIEEYVPGETLEERITRQGRLEPAEAVQVALSLLDVLDYLHQRRIIYRDLKPSNILHTPTGALRLVDFGAARVYREGAAHDTVPLGTPGFASPEHYGRAQTDERSDLYCVGAVLHYMLTGQDPARAQPWTFAPPHEVVPEVLPSLGEVTLTALSLDPRQRYQTVEEARSALHSLALTPTDGASIDRLPRRLITLRHRLQYPHRQDYYRVLETLGIGLFGVFFFAVSIPAWFAHVPLPHPLVGAWLTAYAFLHPYSNWKRYRSMVVEIYHEGFRVDTGDATHEVYWADVIRLRLATPGVVSARSAEVFTRSTRVYLDGVWPGFAEVVQEIIRGAGLVERAVHTPWQSHVDPSERIYERAL